MYKIPDENLSKCISLFKNTVKNPISGRWAILRMIAVRKRWLTFGPDWRWVVKNNHRK